MANLFTETFDTDVADGWGANWTANNNGSLKQSVSGGKGILSTATSHYTNYQNVRATGMADTTDTEMVVDIATTGKSANRLLYFVINDNLPTTVKLHGNTTGTGIWVQMGDTDASATVPTLYARSDGTNLTAALPSISLAGDGATLRLRRVGNTVSAKMWPTGTTEPAGWGATLDISSKSIPAGPIGFRRDSTGNSGTSNTQTTFDNILVTDGVNAVNAEFNAATAAINATAIEPAYAGLAVSSTIDLMTAISSLTPYDAEVETEEVSIVTILPNRDFAVAPNGTIFDEESTEMVLSAGNGANNRRGIFKFDLPSDFFQSGLIRAEIGTLRYGASGNPRETVAIITSLDEENPYNSPVVGEVTAAAGGWDDLEYVDVTEHFNSDLFYGIRVRPDSAPNTTWGAVYYRTSESGTPSVTLRLSYVSVPQDIVTYVDTPTTSLNVGSASFEEVRTVTALPNRDGYRVQGADAFVNDSEALVLSYNPSNTNLSAVLSPQGTTAEKAAINRALERIDFPLESIASAVQTKYGKSTVEVKFEDLPDGDSGGTVLGQFVPDGTILLDPSLMISDLLVGSTLVHEIAHLLDDCFVTMAQRVRLWNAMHDNVNQHVGQGTQITNGAVIHHGHYWSGAGDYLDRVEEAFAQAFVKAYSNFPIIDQFSHPATEAAATAIRQILTPEAPEALGPWPAKTPAIRMHFGPLPGGAAVGTIIGAELTVDVAGVAGGGQYTIHTFSPSGRGYVESAKKTITFSAGTKVIDISDIIDPLAFSGIHIGNVKGGTLQTLNITALEGTGPEPVLTLKYVVNHGATVTDADTATNTLTAHEPVVEVDVSPNATVDVETAAVLTEAREPNAFSPVEVVLSETVSASLDTVDPEVVINFNSVVNLDTPKVYAIVHRVTDVNGEPVLPDETEDEYFISTMDTLTGRTRWISQTYPDSPVEPYRQYWFRMNETSGTIAYDRLEDLRTDVDDPNEKFHLAGVGIGRYDGPMGRHSFHFNGDAHAAHGGRHGPRNRMDEDSLEFSFRTTKKDQFLMGNYSEGSGLLSGADGVPRVWELWLSNGRLEIRHTYKRVSGGTGYSPLYTTEPVAYTGFTDVADGEWHHIVLQTSPHSRGPEAAWFANYWGLEVWIDANLEMRKRGDGNDVLAVTGLPDYIGGRTENYTFPTERLLGVKPLPRESFFVGDMTELIYRHNRMLTEDEVARQRDAMFGILPVRVTNAKATFEAHKPTAKGNKPRILVLDFGFNLPEYTNVDYYTKQTMRQRDVKSMAVGFSLESQAHTWLRQTGEKVPTLLGQSGVGYMAFVGLGDHVTHYPQFETGEYLFFRHPVGPYRDPVTDNDVLIDLDRHLDMEDFDIISIIGYPGNDAQFQLSYGRFDIANVPPRKMMRDELQRVLGQVKDQVKHHGKGLFISDPFSAIAMGIIDQVDMVPWANEWSFDQADRRISAVNPGHDARSLAIDPFGGGLPKTKIGSNGVPRTAWEEYAGGPATMEKRAARYRDTHAISFQRVRALVPGLTDIGSYIRTDELVWYNVNPSNEPPYVTSRKYKNKMAGLSIGDEFYVDHHPADETVRSFDTTEDALVWKDALLGVRGSGSHFYVAAPSSSVRVGTVVTTFTNYMYAGVTEAHNAFTSNSSREVYGHPWGDHAISIAIQPGDTWDGERVTGKVFVNFTEALQPRAAAPRYEPILVWKHLFPDAPASESIAIGEEINFRGGDKIHVTPEMAEWQFTTALDSIGGTEILFPKGKSDWGWSAGGVRGSGLSGGGGQAMNWSSAPPTAYAAIPVLNFSNRALMWMSKDLDLSGSANVNVSAATASVGAHDVEVETTAVTEIDVATARIRTESYTDADTDVPDVTVLAGTATTLLRASGVNSDIALETAGVGLDVYLLGLAESEMVDWSDAIVLRMPRQIATLILEDN